MGAAPPPGSPDLVPAMGSGGEVGGDLRGIRLRATDGELKCMLVSGVAGPPLLRAMPARAPTPAAAPPDLGFQEVGGWEGATGGRRGGDWESEKGRERERESERERGELGKARVFLFI